MGGGRGARSLVKRHPKDKPQPAVTHEREGQPPSPGSPAAADPHRPHLEGCPAATSESRRRAARQHPHQGAARSALGALAFSACPRSAELTPLARASPSEPRLPAATYQGVLSVGGLGLQSCGDIDQGGIPAARAETSS